MKFIVALHWEPGKPKVYPAVEAANARAAIRIVRQPIGHSFTMRATAALAKEGRQ
jgi:hypothetical protein